jgi:uncharacterized protein
MKKLDVLAAALVIVGALNWGLVGAFNFDLVALLVGRHFGEVNSFSAAIYLLVGIAGLYQSLSWRAIQRRWNSDHLPMSA